jgi:penicillin amidase
MSIKLRRFFFVLLSVLLFIAILAVAAGYATISRSFPSTSGEVRLDGLDAPVDIYRDGFGVPHIYAATQHDLFFAQGYVHAQDRFWQMDYWRHIGSGRLAELFGESLVDTDKFLRTLGWARVAQRELEGIDDETRLILEAYAAGVNAYLAEHQGSALSLEYAILKLTNAGYQPEPWQPLHSLTWAKSMAWDLRGNLDDEIERALLMKTLSPAQMAELYPPYAADRPVIVPQAGLPEASMSGLPGEEVAYAALLSPAALERAAQQFAGLDALLGGRSQSLGSNNWVISGKLTTTGKPLLANDPHLSAQIPSIWHQVGLHCAPVGEGCPFDVAGFSFAGAPGVVIGHNNRIAWGFTNTGPDVMDLYIERVNPDNPDQYEVNGRWVDMQVLQETIQVAGGEPVELTIRYTRHGPVITDTYLPEDFSEAAGIELPAQYAVALRWTALEPGYIFRALWKMDKAQNWEQFRAAATDFAVPSQNMVYADVDGNIGYQMPGRIPIRAGGDGRLPVPGWTDDYEWTGTIPFEELPFVLNPPQGYIVTANNAVVGPDYPYLISLDWDYGYRAQSIVDMIEGTQAPIDIAYVEKMQGEDRNLLAKELVPALMDVSLEDAHLEGARQLLQNWDYQMHMDSAPAALYAAFWRHLLAVTFHDDLPEDYWPGGDSRWFEVIRDIASLPTSPWWDDRTTPEVEGRDQVFRKAFADAVAELEERLGDDPTRWAWGDLHTMTLENQTLGRSGIAFIEALFNRGPFRTSGGSSIVNATGWNAIKDYTTRTLPSMRMIVDLGNLSNSLAIHTTGQSGHAYHPHYVDMTDLWRNIQYYPMLWERSQVEAAAEAHLRLVP